MRKLLTALIFFVTSGILTAGSIIVYNGDEVKSEYQCWWNYTTNIPAEGKFADNWLQETNHRPRSGTNCGMYICRNSFTGGVHQLDPNWGGVNITAMTGFSFWARGRSGGESVQLNLFDTAVKTSAAINLSGLTTNWRRFHYSRNQIMMGAETGFDLTRIVGVYFRQATAGTVIFFDDMEVLTAGIPRRVFMDGDTPTHVVFHAGTDWEWGGGSYGRVTLPPGYTGAGCNRFVADFENSKLMIPNLNWGAWDISENINFSFAVRGAAGGESLRVQLRDAAGFNSQPMDVTGLTTAWQVVTFNVAELAEGTSFDLKTFNRVVLEWSTSTIYIDDMMFPATGEIAFGQRLAVPGVVTNTKETTVRFDANVTSYAMGGGAGLPILSARLDLSSLNGPANFPLTNASGTLWQSSFTISTNPLLKGGLFLIPVTASNAEQTRKSTLSLQVRNAVPVALSAFEAIPALVTNNRAHAVLFSVRASSRLTNVKSVYLNLTPLGGGAAVPLTNVAGTSNWQVLYEVPLGTPGGLKTLVTIASDSVLGRGTLQSSFLVVSYPAIVSNYFLPAVAGNDEEREVFCRIRPYSAWTQIQSVTLDLTECGGPAVFSLTNAAGGFWMNSFTVSQFFPAGEKSVPVVVTDAAGLATNFTMVLIVADRTPPTVPVLTSIGSMINQAYMTWDTSTDETGILGYNVYSGMFPDYFDKVYFVGDVASWTNINLLWDQEYYFSVTAVDTSSNESEKSAPLIAETIARLVVYDGDTFPAVADEEDGNLPSTADGSWSGMAWNDEPGAGYTGVGGRLDLLWGGYEYMAHRRAPPGSGTAGIALEGFQTLRMRFKGDADGKKLFVFPYFKIQDVDGVTYGQEYVVELTTAWQEVVIPYEYFATGDNFLLGPVTDVDMNNFLGIVFMSYSMWSGDPATDDPLVVYVDDIVFSKNPLAVSSYGASTTVISNAAPQTVVFDLTGDWVGNLDAVELDLTELGGGVVAMTNRDAPAEVGPLSFRYAYEVPVLPVGVKHVFFAARDDAGSLQNRMVRITNIDREPPTVPADFQAVPHNGKVFLSWSPSTDETAMEGYRISRGTSSGSYDFTTNLLMVEFLTDAGLANDQPYYYAIQSFDSSGNISALSGEVSATPHIISVSDNLATPDIVTNVKNTPVLFRLHASTDLGFVTNVTIDLDMIAGIREVMTDEGGGYYSFLFPVSGLVAGGIYEVPVFVSDSTGMVFETNITITVFQPPVATNGIAHPSVYTNTLDRSISFQMTAKAGIVNITTASLMLSVYGMDNVPMDNISGGTLFGCTVEFSPDDFPLPGGTGLFAQAWVADGSSDTAGMDFLVVDQKLPSNVTLRTVISAPGSVTIRWDPAADESGILRYELYRRTSTGALTLIAMPDGADTEWIDMPSEYRLNYHYSLLAVDAFGNMSELLSPEKIGYRDDPVTMASLIVFDGDEVKANWQCWWPVSQPGYVWTLPTEAPLWLFDDSTTPRSGVACGRWVNNIPGMIGATVNYNGGGVQIVDPNWAGINITHMTTFSFWARGKNGGEGGLNLMLFCSVTVGTQDETFFSAEMPVSLTDTNWTYFEFTRDFLLNGVNENFSLEKFIGVEWVAESGRLGEVIYFDDMKVNLVGAPMMRILDGDIASSAARISGEIMQDFGDATVAAVPDRAFAGFNAERLSASVSNSKLRIFNAGYSTIDVRTWETLYMTIRGAAGGEGLSLTLIDADSRESRTVRFTNLSTDWQVESLDLNDLFFQGTLFDRTRLSALLFTWSEGAGTVDVDVLGSIPPPANPPPSNVVLDSVLSGTNGVQLAWQEATDNTGIAYYEIYRRLAGGVRVIVARVTNLLEYTDVPPQARQIYWYSVKAVDLDGARSEGFSLEKSGYHDIFNPRSTLVVYDGEIGSKPAEWQCWWPTPTTNTGPVPASSWLYDTATNVTPFRGERSGMWVNRTTSDNGGGVQIIDSAWAGINASQMETFTFWARGQVGGEQLDLAFFGRPDGDTNIYYSAPMTVSGLSTTWKEFTFTRGAVTGVGADAGFTLEGLIGLIFRITSPRNGDVVFFDEMHINLVGAPEVRVLDGDMRASAFRTNGELMAFLDAETLTVTNGVERGTSIHMTNSGGFVLSVGALADRAYAGSYAERLYSDFPGAQLQVFNQGWAVIDVRVNTNFSFAVRGESGGEGITIRLKDSPDGELSLPIRLTNLSTNWTLISLVLDDYLQGTSFNRQRFAGIDFEWTEGPGAVYFDEMLFGAYAVDFPEEVVTNAPEAVERAQVRPNWAPPGVDEVTVFFELTESKKVSIQIFDMSGRLVKTLMKPETLPAGSYGRDDLDGKNIWSLDTESKRDVQTGLYFVVVKMGSRTRVSKIMVVR